MVSQQAWLFRTWDEEAVVFDSVSGDTHYLKPWTLAIYQACSQNPGLSEAAVTAWVCDKMSISLDAHITDMSNEALSSLHRIGLLAHS